jgi:D-glycero-beta-D-manno-heptose-7-phosphate kinase
MVKPIDLARFFRERSMIAVVGDVMLDRYISGEVDRVSPEAPVPVVDVSNIRDVLGGAANVMSNLAGLGAQVWGFGVVGDDAEGKILRDELFQRKVDISGIVVDGRKPTTLKCRIVVGHHQMVRYDIETRQELSFDSESKIINALTKIVSARTSDILVISDYNKGVMTPSLIRSISGIAKGYNLRTLVDLKIKNARSYVDIDYIKVNQSNAQKLTGIDYCTEADSEKMCHALAKIFKDNNIILTMGKGGLSIFSQGKLTHIPALARDVYDVTGAGDVVTSSLSMALAAGYDIKTACEISTIAASIKVGKMGTYSLTREELTNEINKLNRLSK